MAPEAPQQPEAQTGNGFDKHVQDLLDKVNKPGKTEDKDESIQEQMKELEAARVQLQDEFKNENDAAKQAKIIDTIVQLDQGYGVLKARGEKKLITVENQLEKRDDLVQQEKHLQDQLDAKKKEVAALPVGDPKLTSLLNEQGELQKQLDKYQGNSKRAERFKKQQAYAEKAAQVHAEEIQFANQKLANDLEGKPTPERKPPSEPEKIVDAPKDTPKPATDSGTDSNKELAKSSGGLAEALDNFSRDRILEIVSQPATTPWEKIKVGMSLTFVRIGLALTKSDHTWCKEIDDDPVKKELALRELGMKIEKDGQSKDDPTVDKYKITWTQPDKEFVGPDQNTQDVFAHYFGDGWLKTYEAVVESRSDENGKPSIKDVEASFHTPPSPEDLKLQALIADLGETDKDTDFLDAVSKKEFSLLNQENAQETASAMNLKMDDAATQKMNEWGVDFKAQSMIGPSGKILHEFKDGDQISVQTDSNGAFHMKIKNGDAEETYELKRNEGNTDIVLKKAELPPSPSTK